MKCAAYDMRGIMLATPQMSRDVPQISLCQRKRGARRSAEA